jgi:hypothetical protein
LKKKKNKTKLNPPIKGQFRGMRGTQEHYLSLDFMLEAILTPDWQMALSPTWLQSTLFVRPRCGVVKSAVFFK